MLQDLRKITARSAVNLPKVCCRCPMRWLARDTPLRHIYFQVHCIFHLTYVDIPTIFESMKKRTTVWLPEQLVERLKKLSRKTGAPMAELFRRAVEAYVKRQT
jgi:Ribbon-helix-helix domain